MTRPAQADPDVIGLYTVERRIGAGGMGVVYLACSPTGRHVALKVIQPEYSQEPGFRGRFTREVAAARAVSGAFTAPVLDADTDGETLWLATEYVDAPTLNERVRQGGCLTVEAVWALAYGLTEALRDIHRAGIVHRDLKPSNVLVTPSGPRVIDFGISRVADGEPLTTDGRMVGTPPYMAPEQVQCKDELRPAADVFALGSVLTFAASGHGPFDADSPYGVIYNVVHEEPDLSGVPDSLLPVIRPCLDKDPLRRPAPDQLLRLLASRGGRSASHGPVDQRGPGRGRRGWLAGSVALGVLIAGTAVVLASNLAGRGVPGKQNAAATRSASAALPLSEPAAAQRPQGWGRWETNLPAPFNYCQPDLQLTLCSSLPGPDITYRVVDNRTGAVVRTWRESPNDNVQAIDNLVIVGNSQWTVYDERTGIAKWHSHAPAGTFQWQAAGGLVISEQTRTSTPGPGDPAVATAWDLQTGRQVWVSPVPYEKAPWYAIPGSPQVVSVTQTTNSTILDGFSDTATGSRWHLTLPSGLYQVVPTDAFDRIFLVQVHPDGTTGSVTDLVAVSTTTRTTTTVPLHGTIVGSPVISRGRIFLLRADGQLTAYDDNTGTRLWTRPTGGNPMCGPVPLRNQIIVEDEDAELVSLDTRNGTELWRSAPRRDVNIAPQAAGSVAGVTAQGDIIAPSERDSLFALTPPTLPTS